MDSEKIELLLTRYWNGETSVEEEQALGAYFREGNFPEQFKEAAALFRYFDLQKTKAITDVSFDSEVKRRLTLPANGKMRTLVFNSMRIAAGIVVLIAAVWLVRIEVRKSTPPEMADTYNDPKVAFEETKKALLMISKSFGTAEKQARKINLFNEAQEEIQKKEEPPSEL